MTNSNTIERLLTKSQEAFVLALETFSRPTLLYRSESTCYLLCNAWELMLKAHLIKERGAASIYYKDKTDRTITLDKCVRLTFTNAHTPARKNLEKIIELRNTSTHFVVPEYESYYAPFIKACFQNYEAHLSRFHGVSIADRLPDNYTNITLKRNIPDMEECKVKYEPEVFKRLFDSCAKLLNVEDELLSNPAYATVEVVELRQVKNGTPSDLTFSLSRDDSKTDGSLKIVKRVMNPNDRYPYKHKRLLERINEMLSAQGIEVYRGGELRNRVTTHDLNNFISAFNMKSDKRFSFDMSGEGEPSWYIYSQETCDLIVKAIKEDPRGCLDRVKHNARKNTQGTEP